MSGTDVDGWAHLFIQESDLKNIHQQYGSKFDRMFGSLDVVIKNQ